jgi:hypothetical protein
MGLGVTGEVGQMPVVVAVLQQRIEDGREDAGFVSAKMIAGNQVERGACFRLVVVVPARIIPAVTALDLFRFQAKQEKVFLAGGGGD